MIISSIVVKRIGLLFPRAGNGKRNRQQGYGGNIFEKIEKKKIRQIYLQIGDNIPRLQTIIQSNKST